MTGERVLINLKKQKNKKQPKKQKTQLYIQMVAILLLHKSAQNFRDYVEFSIKL